MEVAKTDGSGTTVLQCEKGRVSDVHFDLALVGFQGRGSAEVVPPDFCRALLRQALLFQEC